MVARCWGCDRFPPPCQHREQDAGDHQGPPFPTSSALAPTDVDGLFVRLMPIGADKSAVGTVNRPLRMGRGVFQFAFSGPTGFLTLFHELFYSLTPLDAFF